MSVADRVDETSDDDGRFADLEPTCEDPLEERERRRTDLIDGYHLFAALRWGDIGDGHITARDPLEPDSFWMLCNGVDFGAADVDDLVLVRADGTVADGRAINRAGYYIHHPVHAARPDVVAAAHTHTPWGTPFSAERRLIEPISQESCIFFEDQALFDDEEVQVMGVAGGARIAAALGEHRVAILANHGLLMTGSSVADCVGYFVVMERVCEVAMKAREAKPISAAGARRARADLVRPGGGYRIFEWLKRRHLSGT